MNALAPLPGAAAEARRGVGVRIEGVSLAYGQQPVLRGVDLDIRPGEFFAFLGPSGCGKTTLLRLIAGFAEAQLGRVLLDGADITRLPPWKRDVGLVFQSYALWPHMSVRRNVAFGLEERRLKRAEIEARVERALGLVGLTHLADRRPSQLSGGQQQRVALARTVAVEPKLLLLDEPLSNLDAALRVQVRRELRDLQRRLGLTTIFVTHDQEEANAVCDRIAVMQDGVVRQVGTPMELYAKPADLFVAGFLGTANALEGRLEADGRRFRVSESAVVPVPVGVTAPANARLVFRPQDARLLAALPADAGEEAVFKGQVAHREFLGASVRYGVEAEGRTLLADVPYRAGDELRAVGAPVALAVPLAATLWLAGRES